MFMFSFVVALSASAIASPAVSGEIDSGVLHDRGRPARSGAATCCWASGWDWPACWPPTPRWSAGCWVAVVYWVSGYVVPDPAAAAAFLFAEGAVLLTLVLLLSTRLPTLAAGVIGVALFGIAWLAGRCRVAWAARSTSAPCTRRARSAVRAAHRRAVARAPSTTWSRSYVDRAAAGRVAEAQGDPFFAAAAPAWPYLAWAGCGSCSCWGSGLVSFERREL